MMGRLQAESGRGGWARPPTRTSMFVRAAATHPGSRPRHRLGRRPNVTKPTGHEQAHSTRGPVWNRRRVLMAAIGPCPAGGHEGPPIDCHFDPRDVVGSANETYTLTGTSGRGGGRVGRRGMGQAVALSAAFKCRLAASRGLNSPSCPRRVPHLLGECRTSDRWHRYKAQTTAGFAMVALFVAVVGVGRVVPFERRSSAPPSPARPNLRDTPHGPAAAASAGRSTGVGHGQDPEAPPGRRTDRYICLGVGWHGCRGARRPVLGSNGR